MRDPAVREALALRRWALTALSSDTSGAAPAVSSRGWDRFLRREGCALPLRERAGGTAPAGVMDAHATREAKRALAARAELRRLDRLCAANRIPAILLKGGAAAASGGAALDIADVDVLVAAGEAPRLAGLLETAGSQRIPDAEGHHMAAHLDARLVAGSIQIEVHFALEGMGELDGLWARANPVAGLTALRRLSAPDHLHHLLVHAVVQHPERRGRVRDILIIAEGVGECTPAELASVRGRIATHAHARTLGAALAQAEAVASGRESPDPFRRAAAAAYLLAESAWLSGLGQVMGREVARWVYTLLGSAADRAAVLGTLTRSAEAAADAGPRWLPRRLLRALAMGWRCVGSGMAALVGAVLARRARRMAAAA